jgi:hypothetical protein
MCCGTIGTDPTPPKPKNGATGAARRNSTVRSPVATTSSNSGSGWMMTCGEIVWDRKYSKVKATSSAVTGWPSCQVASGRSWKV